VPEGGKGGFPRAPAPSFYGEEPHEQASAGRHPGRAASAGFAESRVARRNDHEMEAPMYSEPTPILCEVCHVHDSMAMRIRPGDRNGMAVVAYARKHYGRDLGGTDRLVCQTCLSLAAKESRSNPYR
jgi:hypothetical protein